MLYVVHNMVYNSINQYLINLNGTIFMIKYVNIYIILFEMLINNLYYINMLYSIFKWYIAIIVCYYISPYICT